MAATLNTIAFTSPPPANRRRRFAVGKFCLRALVAVSCFLRRDKLDGRSFESGKGERRSIRTSLITDLPVPGRPTTRHKPPCWLWTRSVSWIFCWW
ncbi:hypothetical protein Pla52n_15280 [Stieleria varia]|uniref:Uncharacterized protein n=1 Tax=Stieleria varia TaxID=2528005 RepID=A0A5C6B0X9_9BACT|nr:hypothetical protein Pla52n_15280 [Stieleria varia]